MALFISSANLQREDIIEVARPLEDWAEGHSDYTRVSEYIDTTWPLRDLKEYVPEQIEKLNGKKEELRAELASKLKDVDDLISSLAALEYIPESE